MTDARSPEPLAARDRTRDYESYAVRAILLLLLLGCYLVVRPFLTAFLWGAIIAMGIQRTCTLRRLTVPGGPQ